MFYKPMSRIAAKYELYIVVFWQHCTKTPRSGYRGDISIKKQVRRNLCRHFYPAQSHGMTILSLFDWWIYIEFKRVVFLHHESVCKILTLPLTRKRNSLTDWHCDAIIFEALCFLSKKAEPVIGLMSFPKWKSEGVLIFCLLVNSDIQSNPSIKPNPNGIMNYELNPFSSQLMREFE